MVDVPYDRWFIQQKCVVSAFSKDPPLFLIKVLQLKVFSMEILQKYSLNILVILKKILILVLL